MIMKLPWSHTSIQANKEFIVCAIIGAVLAAIIFL